MTETVLQFIVGGLALVFMVWGKLRDFEEICPLNNKSKRLCTWLIRFAVIFVAMSCLVDPLIPGTASLTIHAPSTAPMMLDTLVTETIPIGFLGEAGGERTRYDGFDSRGISQVTVKLEPLETRVKIRLFDKSSPSKSVITESVYVSPFVRRQLSTKDITF